jgi:uncharacterized protein (TIGR03437 family)
MFGHTGTLAAIEQLDLTAAQSAVIDSIGNLTPLTSDVNTQYLGIAPGEMIRITGRGLGPAFDLVAQLDSNGRVANSLGGIQVLFDGVPAPLVGIEPTSITCMTPFSVSGKTTTVVQVAQKGVANSGVIVGVKEVAYRPDVLVVVNLNGTFNTQSTPAHAGQSVIVYATGFGGTSPSVPDGTLYTSPLPAPAYPIQMAHTYVSYGGPAPRLVAGIWQINISLAPGILSGSTPLQMYATSTYLIGPFNPQISFPVWVVP